MPLKHVAIQAMLTMDCNLQAKKLAPEFQYTLVLRFAVRLPVAEATQFLKEVGSRWFEAAFLQMLDKEGLKLELIIVPPKVPQKNTDFFGRGASSQGDSKMGDGGDLGDGDGSDDDSANAISILFCLFMIVVGTVATLSSFLLMWSVGDPDGANRVVEQIMRFGSEQTASQKARSPSTAAQYRGLPTQFCPAPLESPPRSGKKHRTGQRPYNGSPTPEQRDMAVSIHSENAVVRPHSPRSPRYDGGSGFLDGVSPYTQYSSPAHGSTRTKERHQHRSNDLRTVGEQSYPDLDIPDNYFAGHQSENQLDSGSESGSPVSSQRSLGTSHATHRHTEHVYPRPSV
jgi:hypothetical protein